MAAKPSKINADLSPLHAEFAPLQAEHDLFDLNALMQQRDQTKAAAAAYVPPRAFLGIDPQERALLQAASAAEAALRNAQLRVRELALAMQPLKAMLSAPARVTQAQAATAAQAELVTAASEAVTATQATVNNVLGLLADASATYALERDSAARGVLAAAKAGRQGTATLADRGEVESLELALSMAKAELTDAQSMHAAAVQAQAEADRTLRSAKADAARLALELGMRALAPTVSQYRKLANSNYKPGDDLLQLVHLFEYRADDAQTDGPSER